VVTIEALQNTTVEQFNTVKINCAALHVGINTTIQWTLNGSLLETSNNVAFIDGSYNNETCRAAGQIVITNFTTEDVGLYTCFINRSGISYSDNISVYLNTLQSSKNYNNLMHFKYMCVCVCAYSIALFQPYSFWLSLKNKYTTTILLLCTSYDKIQNLCLNLMNYLFTEQYFINKKIICC